MTLNPTPNDATWGHLAPSREGAEKEPWAFSKKANDPAGLEDSFDFEGIEGLAVLPQPLNLGISGREDLGVPEATLGS